MGGTPTVNYNGQIYTYKMLTVENCSKFNCKSTYTEPKRVCPIDTLSKSVVKAWIVPVACLGDRRQIIKFVPMNASQSDILNDVDVEFILNQEPIRIYFDNNVIIDIHLEQGETVIDADDSNITNGQPNFFTWNGDTFEVHYQGYVSDVTIPLSTEGFTSDSNYEYWLATPVLNYEEEKPADPTKSKVIHIYQMNDYMEVEFYIGDDLKDDTSIGFYATGVSVRSEQIDQNFSVPIDGKGTYKYTHYFEEAWYEGSYTVTCVNIR